MLHQNAKGLFDTHCARQDMSLDSPEAPRQLTLFLGRLIVDDDLPPAFLVSVLPHLAENSLGIDIVHATGKPCWCSYAFSHTSLILDPNAGAMLGARHGAERLLRAWSGKDFSIVSLRTSLQACPHDLMRREALLAFGH